MTTWGLTELPLNIDLESKKVLKALPSAHAALAELKGIASTIPNQNILINTLGLQEAKDSSAIENIITTHDDLYMSELNLDAFKSLQAKEVQNYISALKKGFELISKTGLLANNSILQIQEILEDNKAGFRKLPGTALKNAATGETVYTPPQDYEQIMRLMTNLERYINDSEMQDCDPLIKMAIIHFQFESIHPFYDGNGRTGRIINILYLILEKIQSLPILYLSNYIIKHKPDYYRLLQKVRVENLWEEWLLFMINGVEQTAKETIELIIKIKELMLNYKHRLRDNYKFYSQDLLNNLFKHPYTKIEFVVNDLGVSRLTAANYLNKLVDDKMLRKNKLGTGNYYINEELFNLLTTR
ncbi:MAG: Fic family protein [Saprospiraceae bacterium]|nr:Fic family protein [Saprospiraceae bacterium]MBK7795914.1 Fic family protein [Saprospiraceae bacterium]MBK8154669.1 Fic family protein [Saprospiraceae bacterium]MBK9379274.1 Fic family protein [Saprospiraceae bacterium]MBL0261027.1 Fic family protein [Saprospiraceae bacterium]